MLQLATACRLIASVLQDFEKHPEAREEELIAKSINLIKEPFLTQRYTEVCPQKWLGNENSFETAQKENSSQFSQCKKSILIKS